MLYADADDFRRAAGGGRTVSLASGVTAPLRNADYRRLWLGQLVSVIGDKLTQIALALLVYERTGSMLQMGVMLGVTALPAVLFALPAGVAVDSRDRRRLMVAADIGRAVLVLLIMPLARLDIRGVYAVAFLAASLSVLFDPARLSIIPDVLPEEQLAQANSLDQMSMSVSELLGLALGGVLVASLGTGGAFWVDAATFLFSALMIYGIAWRPVAPEATDGDGTLAQAEIRLRDELVSGVRYIASSRVLTTLTLTYAAAAIAGMAMITLIHLLALFTLSGGAITLSVFDVAITVGMLLGATLVSRFRGQHGLVFLGGLLLMGVAVTCLGFVPPTPVTLALLAVSGIANTLFAVASVTITQKETPTNLRGRVFSARSALVRICGVAGLVGAGALAQRFGVSHLFMAVGIWIVTVAVLGLSSPELRQT